jgi:hypothetical protein
VLQPLDATLDRPRVNGISLRWSHIASEPSGIPGLRVELGASLQAGRCQPRDPQAPLRHTPNRGAMCKLMMRDVEMLSPGRPGGDEVLCAKRR